MQIAPRKQARQRRSRQTVDAIVEASLQVLSCGDIAALTTTRAAERAGVSVGTLYQYFPSKEALLEAALRRHTTATVDSLRAAAERSRGSGFEERLGHVLRALVDLKRRNPGLHRALSVLPRIPGLTTKRSASTGALVLLRSLVEEHAQELGGRPSEVVLATVVHAVEGASVRAVEDPRLLASEEFAEALTAMALCALKRAAARSRSL